MILYNTSVLFDKTNLIKMDTEKKNASNIGRLHFTPCNRDITK